MIPNRCMNLSCGRTSLKWHKGWTMRSGAFVRLCDSCGSAYENSKFCDEFHSEESGWRPCSLCGKFLHCGCTASRSLVVLRECGDIFCISCTWNSGFEPVQDDDASGALIAKIASGGNQSKESTTTHCAGAQTDRVGCSFNPPDDAGEGVRDVHEPLAHLNLDLTLGAPLGNSNATVNHHEPELPNPKPSAKKFDRSRLFLARNSPQCTKEELQQLSRDLNSTIVPLFEKMLSCRDVCRLNRIILPKACAKKYFPVISEQEGISLPIQDTKGENLKLRYRYFPKTNSGIYALEGVYAWFQSMELQIGDTVTFYKMIPEGKYLVGFRKAQISEQNASRVKQTWKEAQSLLQTSSKASSSSAVNNDHGIEEHVEHPVLGKKSIFVRGKEEQWVQCDNCSKWRKLPDNIIVPFHWTCEENTSDPSRSSCSAPNEFNTKEI